MNRNNRSYRIRDCHLFLDLWLTPWSWRRPQVWRAKHSHDFYICFGFGKVELIVD